VFDALDKAFGRELEIDCRSNPAFYRQQLLLMSGFPRTPGLLDALARNPEALGLFYYGDRARLVETLLRFRQDADREKVISFFAGYATKSEAATLLDTLDHYREDIPAILARRDAYLLLEALTYERKSRADDAYDAWVRSALQAARKDPDGDAVADFSLLLRAQGRRIRDKLRRGEWSDRSLADGWRRIQELHGSKMHNASGETRDGLSLDMLIAGPAVWDLALLPEADELIRTSTLQPGELAILLFGWEVADPNTEGSAARVGPLDAATRRAYIALLLQGDQELNSYVVLFRDVPAFQQLAIRPLPVTHKKCLVRGALSVMSGAGDAASAQTLLQDQAERLLHSPEAVDMLCNGAPSTWLSMAPGYSFYEAGEKSRLGLALDASDYIGMGLDALDIIDLVAPGAWTAAKTVAKEGVKAVAKAGVKSATRTATEMLARTMRQASRNFARELAKLPEQQAMAIQGRLQNALSSISRGAVKSASLEELNRSGASLALMGDGKVIVVPIVKTDDGVLKDYIRHIIEDELRDLQDHLRDQARERADQAAKRAYQQSRDLLGTWLRAANAPVDAAKGKDKE
jgi:hypothetical protein